MPLFAGVTLQALRCPRALGSRRRRRRRTDRMETPVQLPQRIETARLVLRRPLASDAAGVFDGWASRRAETRFMSWPRHRTVADS